MGLRANIPKAAARVDTRRRLLEAAGEVFAETGFRDTTVLQICQRVGANITEVNYHFGDKQELYKAMLKATHQSATKKYPGNFGLPTEATSEQRWLTFIYSFLPRIFSRDRRPIMAN